MGEGANEGIEWHLLDVAVALAVEKALVTVRVRGAGKRGRG